MIRVYTDENETLVRLGGALHAAEKLRHQINGRYFLQYYSRRGTHSLLRISPSLSGDVGVRRGGVFKAFNSPLLNFQVVWIFCLTVLFLLVLLMPPLFYLFLSKKHGENLKIEKGLIGSRFLNIEQCVWYGRPLKPLTMPIIIIYFSFYYIYIYVFQK